MGANSGREHERRPRAEPDGEWVVNEQGWAAPDTTADGRSAGPPVGPRPRPGAGVTSSPPSPAAPRLPVALRPMTVPDLLDGAFAVIKARPRTVFAIAAWILVPTHLLAAYLQRGASRTYSFTNTLSLFNTPGGTGTAANGSDLLWVYVSSAILALSLFFLGGAIARLVTAWYAGGDLPASEALAASFRRSPALIGAFLLLLLPKVVGFCFCYLPGVVLITMFSLTAPACVVEGLGAVASAQRSWRLVARQFWRCLGVIVAASVGASVLALVMGGLPSLLVGLLPSPFDWIGTAMVGAAVAMITTTALVSVSVLLYIDLRIRTEGLDLELGMADAFTRVP